jgi:hypothetical protein
VTRDCRIARQHDNIYLFQVWFGYTVGSVKYDGGRWTIRFCDFDTGGPATETCNLSADLIESAESIAGKPCWDWRLY